MKLTQCNLIIATFIITGIYDLLLQFFTEHIDAMPSWIQWFDFIGSLKPYFEKHTVLSAILLAGFVGAIAQLIILNIQPFPTTLRALLPFLVLTFLVSALVGLPMQWSGLFPILNDTYYHHLGTWRGLYHDGISGLIVQITLFVLVYGSQFYK